MVRLFTIFLIQLMVVTAFAGVSVTTVPTNAETGDTCHQGSFVTFEVNGNDFAGASSDTPQYIQVRLRNGARLCETRVAPSLFGEAQPIYLAMRQDNFNSGYQVSAPPETLSIARWVAGENEFWLKIQNPSSSWFTGTGQSRETVPPSASRVIRWTVGVSGVDSFNQNSSLYQFGQANLPANTVNPNVLTVGYDTRLGVNLTDYYALHVDDRNVQVAPQAYDNTTMGVETAATQQNVIPGRPLFLSIPNAAIAYLACPSFSISAGANQTLCGNETRLNAFLPPGTTGQWTILEGSQGVFFDSHAPDTTFTGLAGESYLLQWTVTLINCPPQSTNVTIAFTDPITIANAGEDKFVCGNTTSIQANTPREGSTGRWTVVQGQRGQVLQPENPSTVFTGQPLEVYILEWRIRKQGCPDSVDRVRIEFQLAPEITPAGEDQTVCGNQTRLNAETPVNGTGVWRILSGAGGLIGTPESPTSLFQGVPGSTYRLAWVVTVGNCEPLADEVLVTFNETPEEAEAGPNQELTGSVATLAARPPMNGTGRWSVVSGEGGSFEDAANPMTRFRGVPGSSYILRWTLSLTACPDVFDDVVIFFRNEGGAGFDVHILEPITRTSVEIGQTVRLFGQVIAPPDVQRRLNTLWEISDGRTFSNDIELDVTFSRPGRYLIKLFGSDETNEQVDSTTIFVTDPDTLPNAGINIADNWFLSPGDSLFLQAIDRNRAGFQDLLYFWEVNGVDIGEGKTPGFFTFEEEGNFLVGMFATPKGTPKPANPSSTRRIIVRSITDNDFEPNDIPDLAPVIWPGRYRNLELTEDSSVDHFKVEVKSPGQVIRLKATTNGPALVTLLDPDGHFLDSVEVNGSGGLQLTGLSPGAYLIKVEAQTVPGKRFAGVSFGMTLAVLNPSMVFPEIVENGSITTELGIINDTAADGLVELVAFNAAGEDLSTETFEIGPKCRVNQSITEIFGAEIASNVAWVQVNSSVSLQGYAQTRNFDKTEMFATNGVQTLGSELFVPHIARRTDQWFTRASVVNGSPGGSSAQFRTTKSNFAVGIDNDFSQDRFDFLELFGGSVPEDTSWGLFKETGENQLMAGIEVFGKIDGNNQVAGLALSDARLNNPNFTYVENTLHFTHVARDTAQFWTALVLVNISAANQSVRLKAFGPGGVALGEKLVTLGPNEKLSDLAENMLPDGVNLSQVDWIMAEADQAVVGYELFGTHDNKRLAGIEADSSRRPELTFPHIDSLNQSNHGISLVNPNEMENTVTIMLYNNFGEVVDEVTRTLAPMEKLVSTLDALFPNRSRTMKGGWVKVEGTGSLAGFELISDKGNEGMSAILAQ